MKSNQQDHPTHHPPHLITNGTCPAAPRTAAQCAALKDPEFQHAGSVGFHLGRTHLPGHNRPALALGPRAVPHVCGPSFDSLAADPIQRHDAVRKGRSVSEVLTVPGHGARLHRLNATAWAPPRLHKDYLPGPVGGNGERGDLSASLSHFQVRRERARLLTVRGRHSGKTDGFFPRRNKYSYVSILCINDLDRRHSYC